jgi:PAS domain S-box-containing protein
MDETTDIVKLKKEFQELQLRVTRFSAVEQKLIDTRDRLDHELELYKRLTKFNFEALKNLSEPAFLKLITESIIDVLEVETAIVVIKEGDKPADVGVEGFKLTHALREEILAMKERVALKYAQFVPIVLDSIAVKSCDFLKTFNQAILFQFELEEANLSVMMVGCISDENAPLYRKIASSNETIFHLFGQQIRTLFLNRIKSAQIQKQVDRISESDLELKKLSLIATKTKNGVVISDAFGRIEWVNDAFVRITGYELDEVKGLKPKDFLQGEGTDEFLLQTISDGLSKHEKVETVLVNYSKTGKPYFVQLEIIPVFDDKNELVNFISLQRDITLERKNQQELILINSRFELITTRSNIGIWEFNPQTNKAVWNEVLMEQYGAQRSEIKNLGAFWENAIIEEDRGRVVSEVNNLRFVGGDLIEQEFKIKRANDGRIRILKCVTITERNEKGDLLRLIGTSMDITDSKESELRLRASEEKYRGIIENVNIGLIEVDLQGRIIFKNKKIHELNHLFQAEQLILTSNPLLELIQKRKSGLIESFMQVDDLLFEIDIKASNGQLVHYLVSTAPNYNENLALAGYTNVFLDISSLKTLQENLEKALKERDVYLKEVNDLKSFFEQVLNQSPAKTLVLNADLTIRFVNQLLIDSHPYFASVLGCKITELQDQGNQQYIDALNFHIQKAKEERKLVRFESESIQARAGKIDVVLNTVVPNYNTEGLLDNIIVTGVNISELKEIELVLTAKNEELKKINSELDNFVYSVSHDLRSPLMSIKGLLGLIEMNVADNSETTEYVEMAHTSVNRLDGTIQEILEYSRNARLDLRLESFNLREMVDDIVSDLKYSTTSEINFSCNIEGDEVIYSDRTRINTLLKNIIGNAFKYRSHDRASEICFTKRESDQLEIIVSDNGEGIDASYLEKVFQMFFRGTSTSEGTGLGLYICKEISNKLGGTISLESEKGKGTSVQITLPTHTKSEI